MKRIVIETYKPWKFKQTILRKKEEKVKRVFNNTRLLIIKYVVNTKVKRISILNKADISKILLKCINSGIETTIKLNKYRWSLELKSNIIHKANEYNIPICKNIHSLLYISKG